MTRLAESVALELLIGDGIAAIWLTHLAAARAYAAGNVEAAETLLSIAESAEDIWRLNVSEAKLLWQSGSVDSERLTLDESALPSRSARLRRVKKGQRRYGSCGDIAISSYGILRQI